MKEHPAVVPFDSAGSLVERADPHEDTQWDWRPLFEFDASMKLLLDRWGKGHFKFLCQDGQGRRYRIMLAELYQALRRGECFHGHIRGRWGFIQHGASFGLELVSPACKDHDPIQRMRGSSARHLLKRLRDIVYDDSLPYEEAMLQLRYSLNNW